MKVHKQRIVGISQFDNQKTFLYGLQSLIDALKASDWYQLPTDHTLPNLFNQKLPHSVSAGYADTAAMAALNKNVCIGTGWRSSFHGRYAEYWGKICDFEDLNASELQAWIADNKGEIKHLVLFAEHILRYQDHSRYASLSNHDSYLYSEIGSIKELTLTVNLPINDSAGIASHVSLAKFLSENFFNNKLFSTQKTLVVSDGRHRVSITYCHDSACFTLHDANTSQFDISSTVGLAQAIIKSLDIHSLSARHLALRFNLSSYALKDELFDSILKELQAMDAKCADADHTADPNQKPMRQLLKEFHNHSRVGLLRDLLLFKREKINAALYKKIQEYLDRYPSPVKIIDQYKDHLNKPTCSGHSWLHLQLLTGEFCDMHYLLAMGAKPNEGIDPSKSFDEFNKQGSVDDGEYHSKIDIHELGLSYPIHYVVQTNNRYMLKRLVDAGADVNRTTEMGVSPLFLAQKLKHAQIAVFLMANGAKAQVNNNFPQEAIPVVQLEEKKIKKPAKSQSSSPNRDYVQVRMTGYASVGSSPIHSWLSSSRTPLSKSSYEDVVHPKKIFL